MKLADKQKVISVAAVFLLCIGGVATLNYLKFKTRTGLQEKIAKLQAAERAAQEKIKQIPMLLEKKVELASTIETYAEILPPEEHVQHEAFVEIIDGYRQDTKILIQKADYVKVNEKVNDKSNKGQPKKADPFIRHRYRFSLLGTVPDFIDFLNKVENHPRFLKVDSFRIKPSRATDSQATLGGNNPDERELSAAKNPIKEIELTISTYTYKGMTEKKPS